MSLDRSEPLFEDSARGSKNLILVVDDEHSNLVFYSACLEEEGYEVVTASNGSEALEVLRERAPDLIVLDVRMPVMDGYTTCKALRERDETRYTPILFLSALGEEEHVQEGIQSGADDFLAKPVHAGELKVRVRSLLRIRRYRDELQRAITYIRVLQEESDRMREATLA